MRLQQGFVSGGMGFRIKLYSSNPEPLMSALSQKRTSEHFQSMSALPPKADIGTQSRDVRFVPKADIRLSARPRSVQLIVQPNAHDVVGLLRALSA